MKCKSKTIVFFGDSITEAGGTSPAGWTVLLQEKFNTFRKGSYIIHNAGIGGNTTANALDRIQNDVLPFCPATVVIEFGINDSFVNVHTKQNRITISEYKRKLREIVRLIETAGGKCVLVANHLMNDKKSYEQGNGKSLAANMRPYNKFVRELAKEKSLPLIDLEAAMLEAGTDVEKFLQEDGVHLTPYGMEQYAKFIWAGLRNNI